MSDSDDRQRLDDAIAGDQSALGQLLLDHYEPLRRHIQGKLSANHQAVLSVDDIIQDAYTHVFRDIAGFTPRDDASFLAWLKTVADNRLRDAIRKANSKKRGGEFQRVFGAPSGSSPFLDDLVEQYATTSRTPSREAAREEAIQAIQVAVASLPEEHRRVVQLRYFDGLSIEECAKSVGKTTGAVRGLLDRARRRIRESLANASAYLSTR